MCGIAGAFGPKRVSERAALRSLELMAQRGPDAAGQYRAAVGSNEICLLHTRLAIIDLTADANQPFRKHGCAVVFNGELYNYREMREELEARGGHRFQTQSDTEVLLEAYLAWGEDCVDRFEGMWAFALHDEARGALILRWDPLESTCRHASLSIL